MSGVRWMLSLAIAAAVAVAGCGTAADSEAGADSPGWSQPCPELGGEPLAALPDETFSCLGTDADHRPALTGGKPLVLALWASWCDPCVAEAPHLQAFHDAVGDQVVLLGVDTQDTRDHGRAFAADFGWTFPSVFDERGTLLRHFGGVGLPGIAFVTADGELAEYVAEPGSDLDGLLAGARQHFGVTP